MARMIADAEIQTDDVERRVANFRAEHDMVDDPRLPRKGGRSVKSEAMLVQDPRVHARGDLVHRFVEWVPANELHWDPSGQRLQKAGYLLALLLVDELVVD